MADSVAYDKYMKDTLDEAPIDIDDLDAAGYNSNAYGAGKGMAYEDDDEYAEEISQEDCWDVIRAFFEERVLCATSSTVSMSSCPTPSGAC